MAPLTNSCKFSHQMAQLGLVQNLVIRWRHLHCLQSWPPGCVTCIAALLWIVLFALSVSIDLVSSSARVTSVKSAKGGRTDRQTDIRTSGHPDPKIGPQVYLGPIKTPIIIIIIIIIFAVCWSTLLVSDTLWLSSLSGLNFGTYEILDFFLTNRQTLKAMLTMCHNQGRHAWWLCLCCL